MATQIQAAILELLPNDLAILAVDLTEMAGSKEYCFPVAVAKDVLKILLAKKVVVLGGDIWDMRDGEYFAIGDNWYVDTVEAESQGDRAARVSATAGKLFDRYVTVGRKGATFIVKAGSLPG